MRFLIFNLVVVGALFYLFTGGQLPVPEDANGVLHKVSVAAKNTVAAGRKATAAVVEKVLPEPLAPIQAAPIEVPTQAAVPPIPVQIPVRAKLAVPKAPTIKQTSARTTNPNLIPPAIDDHEVRQRQAEVLATGPVASVEGQTAFMSPSQRRRELHALSEEMELLFASSRMN
jgi:hypothetical protein